MSGKEILLFSFLIFIAFLLWVLIFLLLKNRENKNDNSSKLIQDHLFNISKSLDDKLTKNFEINSKISLNSNKTIEEITKKLTSLEETNKQIKGIWWQLEWLESILKNPKQKWNLWEYFLKELLENVFWDYQYKMQYKVWDIWIVDAALFIWTKIIPIDSKFPYDNYEKLIKSEDEASIKIYSTKLKRDLKDKIDETSRYIDTSLETTNFAFMLIPAEWIYYDIFISKIWDIDSRQIIEYGFSKKVIICSPSWFYAYLQTVIQWLRSLEIEEKTKDIVKQVDKLAKHLESYELYFKKLWNSLNISINHYNEAEKKFGLIEKDVVKITWDENLKIE